jgi:hypothetical protein
MGGREKGGRGGYIPVYTSSIWYIVHIYITYSDASPLSTEKCRIAGGQLGAECKRDAVYSPTGLAAVHQYTTGRLVANQIAVSAVVNVTQTVTWRLGAGSPRTRRGTLKSLE